MERKKCVLIFILMAGVSTASLVSVEQNTFRADLYNVYIRGDMEGWQSIVNKEENPVLSGSHVKIELLEGYYGLIGYLLGNNRKKEASVYVEKGQRIIEGMLKENPEDATALAFRAAFYGFSIGVQRIKAMYLGPKSINSVNSALEKDPENIQAHIEKANILFYSPMMVGGDKTKSVEFYQKACSLMEKKNLTSRNWLYLSTCVQLAQVYRNNGQTEKAKEIYEKILIKEPEFEWVKEELLPGILKVEMNK